MFFKNLQIYRVPGFSMTADALASMLAPQAFTPPSSNELLRQGWDAPRPAGGLVHAVNKQMLLLLRTEKKLLPNTVINQVAKARAAEMEEAQGFAPGKKAMRELKERVADELLPRAFSIQSTTPVWIDPVHGWLVVDAASPAKADEAIKLLLKAVERMPLESLRVQRSPVGVMTDWLATDEAPAGFTVDQDATLRATGESKAQVAFKHHSLDPDDVRKHIAAGKQCTRLAMTWNSKISFVLDESLAVKSLKPLDVLTESDKGTIRNDDERFDGDFALMAGELAKLLADLMEALGGEADGIGVQRAAVEHCAAGQQKVERAIRLTAEMYKTRDMHRAVLNELYDQTIQPVIGRVREHMAANNLGAIEAALAMAKALPPGSQSQQLLLVAAIEIVEPSLALAKGDEPVCEQRGVLSYDDHLAGQLARRGMTMRDLEPQADANAPAGDGSASDTLYDQAVAVVLTNQRASISLVQRHLRVGYNRAARLLEAMEGTVVGPLQSNGNRELLVQGGAV